MQTRSQEIPKDEFPTSLVASERAVSRFQPHAVPHLVRGRVVTRLWLWGLVTREGLILSPDWHGMHLIYSSWALGFIPKITHKSGLT